MRRAPFLILIVAATFVAAGASTPADEKPMPIRTISAGYDLTSAVQAVIEEVDGAVPAPSLIRASGFAPGTIYLQSDRRAEDAIVVGLWRDGSVPVPVLTYRADIQRAGQSLVEGMAELNAVAGSIHVPQVAPSLLAPIHLPPSTPLVVSTSFLPGEPIVAAIALTLYVDVLYCSSQAARAVLARYGEARWWAFWAGRAATQPRNQTLVVELGGRPTYVRATQANGASTVRIMLDGRQIIVPDLVFPTAANVGNGMSMMAHEATAGQIYRFEAPDTTPDALNRLAFQWHGPSWAR